ncbi:unnamed protein product [Ectocarpus sp. 6 AP-2014]
MYNMPNNRIQGINHIASSADGAQNMHRKATRIQVRTEGGIARGRDFWAFGKLERERPSTPSARKKKRTKEPICVRSSPYYVRTHILWSRAFAPSTAVAVNIPTRLTLRSSPTLA